MAQCVSDLSLYRIEGGVRSKPGVFADRELGLNGRYFVARFTDARVLTPCFSCDPGKSLLARFQISETAKGISLSAAGKTRELLLGPEEGADVAVKREGRVCRCSDLGDAAARWLNHHLGQTGWRSHRLLKVVSHCAGRGEDRAYAKPLMVVSEETLVYLQHLVEAAGGSTSPDDLQYRLRANLVIRGMTRPFAEETISTLEVGQGNVFEVTGHALCPPSLKVNQWSGHEDPTGRILARVLWEHCGNQVSALRGLPAGLTPEERSRAFVGVNTVLIKRGSGAPALNDPVKILT